MGIDLKSGGRRVGHKVSSDPSIVDGIIDGWGHEDMVMG